MDTRNLKAAKDLPRTHYNKVDNSGRKRFLKTAITRGGDCESLFFVVLQVGTHRALLGSISLYFRTLMNGCMTHGLRGLSCVLT